MEKRVEGMVNFCFVSDEVIRKVAAGDRRAFRSFYDAVYPLAYRFIHYFLPNPADCEEVVSEVFFIFWKERRSLTDKNDLKAWIYTVCRNEAYHYIRQMERAVNVSIDDMPVELMVERSTVDGAMIEEEMLEIYNKAVRELPERCKLVFLMVREERLKHKEVAQILQIAEGTVEQQMNIAIRKIVDTVRRYYPFPSLDVRRNGRQNLLLKHGGGKMKWNEEKRTGMNLYEDDTNGMAVDEICKEALRVLDAVGHPDVSAQMADGKEAVFRRVNGKIEADAALRVTSGFRYLMAAGVALLLALTASAAYHMGRKGAAKQLSAALVETVAPLGMTSRVVLADGTAVTLNGGSKLTYPAVFVGDERAVTLVGEGFFDVAKDAAHPFLVRGENLTVEVLGTKFGFRSYKEDMNTVVTLKEGAVKALPLNAETVEALVLKPNQQLTLDNRTGEFQCRFVDAAELLAWKDGELYFRDNTLDEIARVLERRFNVSITITTRTLKDDRYFAHFGSDEGLDKILTLLSHKRHWKYENKNGTIVIK